MKISTLIVCIDRDNDIGKKVGITSPVIGIDNNIESAKNLSLVDPEDSDSNTIFAGAKIALEILESDKNVNMITIAGDENVGIVSDSKISKQLDDFLSNNEVEQAIIVTDGAEDEAILPIIQSRLKIIAIKRIVINQYVELENTYYMIKNMIRDPNIYQTFIVPIGITMIVYALFLLGNYPQGAISGIMLSVGGYIIYYGYGLHEPVREQIQALKNKCKIRPNKRTTSMGMLFVSILIFFISTIYGLFIVRSSIVDGSSMVNIVGHFIDVTIWWYIVACILKICTSLIDPNNWTKEKVHNLVIKIFFVTIIGIIIWLVSQGILLFSDEICSLIEMYYS